MGKTIELCCYFEALDPASKSVLISQAILAIWKNYSWKPMGNTIELWDEFLDTKLEPDRIISVETQMSHYKLLD